MADSLKGSLFETRKLWNLHPTLTLPFDSALANPTHEMDSPTIFVTHQLSIYVQSQNCDINHIF